MEKRIRIGRFSFAILSTVFAICVLIQVFFAGLATFINPINWIRHETFVHFFELAPILMLITAFIGKMPKWAHWQSAALLGLIFIIYFTAHSSVLAAVKYTAALHPVIAMLIFIFSIHITRRSYDILKKRQTS